MLMNFKTSIPAAVGLLNRDKVAEVRGKEVVVVGALRHPFSVRHLIPREPDANLVAPEPPTSFSERSVPIAFAIFGFAL
jgi:hypothetical protein